MGVLVSADSVTRQHYGDMTPGFSQGNALGGKIERKFADGGPTSTDGMTGENPVQKSQIDTARLRQLVERINRTSNADFVKRLLDKDRKVLD